MLNILFFIDALPFEDFAILNVVEVPIRFREHVILQHATATSRWFPLSSGPTLALCELPKKRYVQVKRGKREETNVTYVQGMALCLKSNRGKEERNRCHRMCERCAVAFCSAFP